MLGQGEFHTPVQEAFLKSAAAKDPMEKASLAPTLGEVLKAQFPGNHEKQEEVLRSIHKSMEYKTKDTNGVGIADLSAMRVVSRAESTPVIRNKDSKFFNLLEMQGAARKVTDPQFKINERDIINNEASPFNLDSPTLPGMIQSQYYGRTNTIMPMGQQVGVSIFASEVSAQQGTLDVKADQLDDAHKRIRKGSSRLLLNNTEVVSEQDNMVPQCGGFIGRSTTPGNTLALGGNFTEAQLNAGYKLIRNKLGSEDLNLVLWTDQAQVQIIDNLMIQRFPGENSQAHFATQEFGKRMAEMKLNPDTVYKLRPGMYVPVISDDQLPAGYSVLFDVKTGLYPRLARFQMFGQEGPYDLVRPEKTLFEVVVSFDLVSLDDAIQPSRVIYTGVN